MNTSSIEKSRIGDIVVNIEQLHSDNNLRDARIRQDFLESHAHPLATFHLDEISGITGPVKAGETYTLTLTGSVTVKETTAKATFAGTATLADDGSLDATATTDIKLSRFGAGPITVAGLVSTSDDATITLELKAVDPTKVDLPDTFDASDERAAAGDAPSFSGEIQPILDARCVRCHDGKDEKVVALTGREIEDPGAKRRWSEAYLALTHARPDDRGKRAGQGRADQDRALRVDYRQRGDVRHLDGQRDQAGG